MLDGRRAVSHHACAAPSDGEKSLDSGLGAAFAPLAPQTLPERTVIAPVLVSPVRCASSPASRHVSSFLMLRLMGPPYGVELRYTSLPYITAERRGPIPPKDQERSQNGRSAASIPGCLGSIPVDEAREKLAADKGEAGDRESRLCAPIRTRFEVPVADVGTATYSKERPFHPFDKLRLASDERHRRKGNAAVVCSGGALVVSVGCPRRPAPSP